MDEVRLTTRETQFLQLTHEGLTQEEIATQLSLSIGRIQDLARQVRAKLQANTAKKAAKKAKECGLI